MYKEAFQVPFNNGHPFGRRTDLEKVSDTTRVETFQWKGDFKAAGDRPELLTRIVSKEERKE